MISLSFLFFFLTEFLWVTTVHHSLLSNSPIVVMTLSLLQPTRTESLSENNDSSHDTRRPIKFDVTIHLSNIILCGHVITLCGYVIILCEYVNTLGGHVIILCGHVITLCGHVIILCGHVITLGGHVIILCGHVIILCGHVIILCGYVIILCWYVITLGGHVIILCGHVITLCGHVILLCGYLLSWCQHFFMLCGYFFSFRYVQRSYYYTKLLNDQDYKSCFWRWTRAAKWHILILLGMEQSRMLD